jgi:hypothetical protein
MQSKTGRRKRRLIGLRAAALAALVVGSLFAAPASALDLNCVSVQGTALDPYGRPAAGVGAQVHDACADTTQHPRTGTTDSNGRFTLYTKRPSLPDTNVSVTFYGPWLSVSVGNQALEATVNPTTDPLPDGAVPAENTRVLMYSVTLMGLAPSYPRPGDTVSVEVVSTLPDPAVVPGSRLVADLPDGTRIDLSRAEAVTYPHVGLGYSHYWRGSFQVGAAAADGAYSVRVCAPRPGFSGTCASAAGYSTVTPSPDLAADRRAASYTVDGTAPDTTGGRIMPMSGGNAVAGPQPLLIKATDATSGLASSGVQFTLTDTTAGATTSHQATSTANGWYKTAAVALVEGHVYRVAATVTDRAGNSVTASQAPLDQGGGFLAIGLPNLASASRATASMAAKPCEVSGIDTSDPTNPKRTITCRDVSVDVASVPVTLTATRHPGIGYLTQTIPLDNLKIHPTLAGSSIGQADIAPKAGTAAQARQRFKVSGPLSTSTTTDASPTTLTYTEITAVVGPAVDAATIDMAPSQASAVATLACANGPTSTAWCSPDPLPPVVSDGGVSVIDVVSLPGAHVVASLNDGGGYVGGYGAGIAGRYTTELDVDGDLDRTRDTFEVEAPDGTVAQESAVWRWWRTAGWNASHAPAALDLLNGGASLNAIARAFEGGRLGTGLNLSDPPLADASMASGEVYRPMSCIETPKSGRFYSGRGCYERSMGEEGSDDRYLGDRSFASGRGEKLTERLEDLSTIHTYSLGQVIEWSPKITLPTNCANGKTTKVGFEGYGLSLSVEETVCPAKIDPILVDFNDGDGDKYTTKWVSNEGNGSTGTQYTEQTNATHVSPNSNPSGFLYAWQATARGYCTGFCLPDWQL